MVKYEGIFAGYTSGAAFQALKQLNDLNEFKEGDNIVVIFPDHGSRYLSKIYNDEWMLSHGFNDEESESNNVEYIK